eukprot:15421-Heterococcus_DN1.PRE.3
MSSQSSTTDFSASGTLAQVVGATCYATYKHLLLLATVTPQHSTEMRDAPVASLMWAVGRHVHNVSYMYIERATRRRRSQRVLSHKHQKFQANRLRHGIAQKCEMHRWQA